MRVLNRRGAKSAEKTRRVDRVMLASRKYVQGCCARDGHAPEKQPPTKGLRYCRGGGWLGAAWAGPGLGVAGAEFVDGAAGAGAAGAGAAG
jgi:hypothetical protein